MDMITNMKNIMDISNMLTRKDIPQWVLAIVGILYILGDINPPHVIAEHVTRPIGILVLIAIAVLLSRYVHPMVTIIYLVAAYELYERSYKSRVRGPERKLPKDKRMPSLTPENQFPVTLEEQVVKKMAPWVMKENIVPPSYKPVLDDDMNASSL